MCCPSYVSVVSVVSHPLLHITYHAPHVFLALNFLHCLPISSSLIFPPSRTVDSLPTTRCPRPPMTSYCDHWVANHQLDMRTPLYDSDESGSELSGSWLDISKDEELEDDDHLSSTASAVGSSTISNISPSEVSSDTEGFSLSSDESQPDLDADNDVDVDVESDTDEDKTPAASFDKFTSGFIFPDPTSSFSTIDETPVPSIYNVPSEPLWQGVNDRLPPDTASDSSPTKSTSTAEATDKKQAATDHPFQARSPATAPSRRRFLLVESCQPYLGVLMILERRSLQLSPCPCW